MAGPKDPLSASHGASSPLGSVPGFLDAVDESKESQPPSASKTNFEALREAMGEKVDLLDHLPFDRVQLIPHTDDGFVGRKTLAPWKLNLGTTKHDEPIYAYIYRSVSFRGADTYDNFAVTTLRFSTYLGKQCATPITKTEVLQEHLKAEYRGASSENQLKVLIGLYFIFSGASDAIKYIPSKYVLEQIEAVCHSFVQQNIRKVSSTAHDSIEWSTPTGLEGPGSSADHHRSVQLNSKIPNQEPICIPATKSHPDFTCASSAPIMTSPRASPNTQASLWLSGYKKEIEYPLATARVTIRDITVQITTCRAELETLKQDNEKAQAERLRLQKDREKAQADLVKAQAALAKADADLAKTNATLDKDIEGEQNRLYAKIDGFENEREQAKNDKERVQKLKVEIFEYVSTTMDDEPAAKRMRRD